MNSMLLGIDLGTTSVKALLADDRGCVSAVGSAPVGIEARAGGAVEQDIEDIWRAVVSAVRQAMAASPAARVAAVGVSSQGGAMQILDQAQQPVGKVISWQDSRGSPWNQQVAAQRGRAWLSRHVGCGQGGITIGQILRLRSEGAWRENYNVGYVGDVIVGRLTGSTGSPPSGLTGSPSTGRRAHDATSLSLAILLNPELGREDDEVLAMLGLRREQLPALLSAGQAAGGLSAQAADLLGLPAGVPVGPAVHDQYAAALGCGAVEAGDVMVGAGTAWVVLAITDHLAAGVTDATFVAPHPVAGLYGQILSLVNGGSSISWALRTLGLAKTSGRELDALLASVTPGCDGASFRPLLIEGAVGTGGAGGRWDGLRLNHTPAHLVRAVVEGLACELARHLKFLADQAMPASKIILCGPAAASSVTPQIVADTTGLPIDCAAEAQTSCLGAAMLARHLLEPQTPLAEISRQMKPAVACVQAGPQREQAAARFQAYLDGLAEPGSRVASSQ